MNITPATQSEITSALVPIHDAFMRHGSTSATAEPSSAIYYGGGAEYTIYTPQVSFDIQQETKRFALPGYEAGDLARLSLLRIVEHTSDARGWFACKVGPDGLELVDRGSASDKLTPEDALRVCGVPTAEALTEVLAQHLQAGNAHRGVRSRQLALEHEAMVVAGESEVLRNGKWLRSRFMEMRPIYGGAHFLLKAQIVDGHRPYASPLVEVQEFVDGRPEAPARTVITPGTLRAMTTYLKDALKQIGSQ